MADGAAWTTTAVRGSFARSGARFGDKDGGECVVDRAYVFDVGGVLVVIEGSLDELAEWFRGRYLSALKAAGRFEELALVRDLNPRVHPLDDACEGEEDVSARHLVDVFGVTMDVRRTVDGTVLDVGLGGVPAEHRPVHVSVGDFELTA